MKVKRKDNSKRQVTDRSIFGDIQIIFTNSEACNETIVFKQQTDRSLFLLTDTV